MYTHAPRIFSTCLRVMAHSEPFQLIFSFMGSCRVIPVHPFYNDIFRSASFASRAYIPVQPINSVATLWAYHAAVSHIAPVIRNQSPLFSTRISAHAPFGPSNPLGRYAYPSAAAVCPLDVFAFAGSTLEISFAHFLCTPVSANLSSNRTKANVARILSCLHQAGNKYHRQQLYKIALPISHPSCCGFCHRWSW